MVEIKMASREGFGDKHSTPTLWSTDRSLEFFALKANWGSSTCDEKFYHVLAHGEDEAIEAVREQYARENYISSAWVDVR